MTGNKWKAINGPNTDKSTNLCVYMYINNKELKLEKSHFLQKGSVRGENPFHKFAEGYIKVKTSRTEAKIGQTVSKS